MEKFPAMLCKSRKNASSLIASDLFLFFLDLLDIPGNCIFYYATIINISAAS